MARIQFLAMGLGALALTGCGSLTLSAIHDPLYRASSHVSTITATAQDSDKGVASIEIDVVEGDLTACTENGPFAFPSLIPCRINATARSRVCTFGNATSAVSCSLPMTTGDRRLITYTTKATNGAGDHTSTNAITYAAGAPLTQTTVQIPPFNIPMAWETARPVWWHTDAPPGDSLAPTFDVGFFPDADFANNYQGFTDGMQPIVLGSYFNTTDQFASTYSLWRNVFNFWAGPDGADAQDCTRTFSGSAATVAGATDGDAILHQNAFRDCASLALGGSGSTQTTLGDAAWVFTHESGHFLHGLGDEYVGGGNASISDPANIYGSQSACQTAATSLSINTSFCVQIGTTGMWRMDDGNATTMEDRTLSSDWRTASGIAVNRRIGKCISGACY
jgi:hypothetical protein